MGSLPIRLGSIVHLELVGSHPKAYVVCGEDVRRDMLRLSYCGTVRWYAAKWFPREAVTLATDEANKNVRRAHRLLAKVRADPDGWRRIQTGRRPNCTLERVGHIALDQQEAGR